MPGAAAREGYVGTRHDAGHGLHERGSKSSCSTLLAMTLVAIGGVWVCCITSAGSLQRA